MWRYSLIPLVLIISIIMKMHGCILDQKDIEITQLTHSERGHTLHHNGVFSKDGQWIVFDARNEDTKIGETSEIGVVNLLTKEEKIIYQAPNASKYGPGVGAASFSPESNRIIFIHGLLQASKDSPYDITRRTGVAIDLARPFQPIFMDARDITDPYVPGSLRGGTHSHCWSPDGKLISFTYNDALVESNLRTVGVMWNTGTAIEVDPHDENNNGIMYAAIVANVVDNPTPGSDEINKAFDECWVGRNGYVNATGQRIPHAIAFQGNTKNENEETITEIYIVDIDTSAILKDDAAVGKAGMRPIVPKGLMQRRISRTKKGLASVRHWLRSSADGQYIYALAEDDRKLVQIIQCNVHSGEIEYLTNNNFSIKNPFNVSEDGSRIAFIGNNNVYLLHIHTKDLKQLTNNTSSDENIVGAPCFSPDGKILVYNQYKRNLNNTLQIMYKKLENDMSMNAESKLPDLTCKN